MVELNKIYCEDCLETMLRIPDNSIDCCVTSPPYYGLRDYGVDGQIGLEATPELYIQKLIKIFTEVKRILKKEGTLWLNLGDCYAGSGKASGQKPEHKNCGKIKQKRGYDVPKATPSKKIGLKSKDLIGIPWMVAFALRADGWWLRQDIIWSKPNPMPESVTDRCTKSHEYIFLLSKSKKYYYDQKAIKEKQKDSSIYRASRPFLVDLINRKHKPDDKYSPCLNPKTAEITRQKCLNGEYANKKSVWIINTQPFKGAHFAVFPEKLIVPCIKAGCPENGIVYDPFIGAGTTAIVAIKLNRNWIGSELSQKNVDLANNRIAPYKTQLKLQYD